MITFKTITLSIFGALIIIGCKNEPKKTKTLQSNVKETSTTVEQQISFHKILTSQHTSYDIKTSGEGSIRQLSIQPKGLEINNEKIVLEIEGQVVNAEIEDLNSDGFPEILIYTIAAGSGSYGNVIGYSENNGKSLSQIYFPEIANNEEASVGYMGHDEFSIIETSLIQKFPIYKKGDSNSNPTGGTRQIHYKLIDGEASRIFVIDKINNIAEK